MHRSGMIATAFCCKSYVKYFFPLVLSWDNFMNDNLHGGEEIFKSCFYISFSDQVFAAV